MKKLICSTIVLALLASHKAIMKAQPITVTLINEFAYNPPRKWIPPDEDKAGYWYQKDYGVIEHMDLNLPTQAVAVVTKSRQPDGFRLITLDLSQRTIRKNRIILDQFGAAVKDMALSPNAEFIAVTEGKGARLSIWSAATLSKVGSGATDGTVNALAWSPDGSQIAVSDKTSIEIWSTSQPMERRKFLRGVRSTSGAAWISDVAWSPDGNFIAIGTNEPAVYIHNLSAGMQRGLQPKPTGAVTQLEWSPDGGYLSARVQGYNGEINIWENPKLAADPLDPYMHNNTYTHIAQLQAANNGQNLGRMAFDPSSKMIVFSNKRGQLLFHDLQTGKRIKTIQAHNGTVKGLVWQGNILLSYAMYPDRKFIHWRVKG